MLCLSPSLQSQYVPSKSNAHYAEMAAKGHALLNRIEAITTEEERNALSTVTRRLVENASLVNFSLLIYLLTNFS